jgi:hypothetical protein
MTTTYRSVVLYTLMVLYGFVTYLPVGSIFTPVEEQQRRTGEYG